MNGTTDVAIVGAGPYGLSVAAHLRRSGRERPAVRAADAPVAGEHAPGHVPEVAGLRLQPVRPGGPANPGARSAGRPSGPYADYGLPVPLDTFVAYGQWFQSSADLDVEEILVTGVAGSRAATSSAWPTARRCWPARWSSRPGSSTSPTCPAAGRAARRRCARTARRTPICPPSAASGSLVVGAGQSALESAALLHEHGAEVQIVMRKRSTRPGTARRWPRTGRCCSGCESPRPGSGSGWGTWFYSRHPAMLPAPAASPPGSTGPAPRSARPVPAGCAAGWKVSSRSWPARRWTGAEAGPNGVRLGLAAQHRRTGPSWPPTMSSRPPATGRTWAG